MHFLQSASSPSPTFAVQTGLDGRYSLGLVIDATTSSGTGGGGSGNPQGACPHEDEPVCIRRAGVELVTTAVQVCYGDEIKGYSFAHCADEYRKVISIRHCESTMWFRVCGHLCSPCESVYVDGAWYPAWQAPGAERVRGVPAQRIEISVMADTHDERNYYLTGDTQLLIHNFISAS